MSQLRRRTLCRPLHPPIPLGLLLFSGGGASARVVTLRVAMAGASAALPSGPTARVPTMHLHPRQALRRPVGRGKASSPGAFGGAPWQSWVYGGRRSGRCGAARMWRSTSASSASCSGPSTPNAESSEERRRKRCPRRRPHHHGGPAHSSKGARRHTPRCFADEVGAGPAGGRRARQRTGGAAPPPGKRAVQRSHPRRRRRQPRPNRDRRARRLRRGADEYPRPRPSPVPGKPVWETARGLPRKRLWEAGK